MPEFIQSKKPHIKEYWKIRKMHDKIINSMLSDFFRGRFEVELTSEPSEISGEAFESRRLSLIGSSEGVYDFIELLCYKTSPSIACMTEEYLNKNRYRKPEKIKFLEAMLNSRARLFEIAGTDAFNGYVYLRDVFTNEELKIIDTDLSLSEGSEGSFIFARVIFFNGMGFGAGQLLAAARQNAPLGHSINKSKYKGDRAY